MDSPGAERPRIWKLLLLFFCRKIGLEWGGGRRMTGNGWAEGML